MWEKIIQVKPLSRFSVDVTCRTFARESFREVMTSIMQFKYAPEELTVINFIRSHIKGNTETCDGVNYDGMNFCTGLTEGGQREMDLLCHKIK